MSREIRKAWFTSPDDLCGKSPNTLKKAHS